MIDIERTVATVSGEISVGQSAATEFYGWLELIDQLEDAVGRHGVGGPGDALDALAAGMRPRGRDNTAEGDAHLP